MKVISISILFSLLVSFGLTACQRTQPISNSMQPTRPAYTGPMPDWSLNSTFGELDLVSDFSPNPISVDIRAGGDIDANQAIGGNCVGWIARAPDYRMFFNPGRHPIRFSFISSADTTLVINIPNTDWYCDDDAGEGLNPSITLNQPIAGQYDIWVGTYVYDPSFPSGQLYIGEIR